MSSFDRLNPSQKTAVTLPAGHAFVLAGAGTGKTSVLTHRIQWLVQEQGLHISEIMAVTFTNKAAKEMKERLGHMLSVSLKDAWIGTFHGLALRILRSNTKLAGFDPHFTIMDEAEQMALIKRTQLAVKNEFLKEEVVEIQRFINQHKEKGLRPDQIECGPKDSMTRMRIQQYRDYEARCHQESSIDFAELMLRSYELLRDHEALRVSFHQRFRHVLIDEFQDTNSLQYKWIRLIVGPDAQAFAVGDDDQCLVGRTPILMGNGLSKPLQDIHPGEKVLSHVGAELYLATVQRITQQPIQMRTLYRIKLAESTGETRDVVCSSEHTWFVYDTPPTIKEGVGLILCAKLLDGKPLHAVRHNGHSEMFDTYEQALAYAYRLSTQVVCWANVGPYLALQLQTSELRVGMPLMVYGKGPQPILEVSTFESDEPLFDLDVSETHQFFANGILSHNSIYSWRGAMVKNVNSFLNEYQATLIKLEENYRSTAPILELANATIDLNTQRLGKVLKSTKRGQIKPLCHGANDQQDEANYVVDRIKEGKKQGLRYRDMAVLYRASALSRSFEQALNRSGIPCRIFGGMRFFERQEVKHALAYLKLMAAPQDDGAFLRVINVPPRGIGATSLEKLQEYAKANQMSCFDSLNQTPPLTGKAKKAAIDFHAQMMSLQQELNDIKGVADKLKYLMNASGLRAWYQELIDADKEPEERLENLDELISAARGFEKEFPEASVADFLSTTALETSSNKTDKEEDDYVSLMTIHAAKGLEFEMVFFVGLEEGIIPHARCSEPSEEEEERRLFYVAITRAKTTLVLTVCDTRMRYGDTTDQKPSPFLKELGGLKELVSYTGLPNIGRALKLRN
jgi:superfamily I DNA/RNA helicase